MYLNTPYFRRQRNLRTSFSASFINQCHALKRNIPDLAIFFSILDISLIKGKISRLPEVGNN